jgi:hypothetical protein
MTLGSLVCQVCVAVIAVIAYVGIRLCMDFNVFATSESFGDAQCRLVHAAHAVGLEDGDEQNGVVVFGADNRRGWLKVGADKSEGLRNAPNGHLLQWRNGAFHELQLIGIDGIAFHPHGVSFRGSLLFVVNHDADGGDTVFVFEIDAAAGTATLRTSVNHSLLHGLNDIVALSATEFYATRWENAPVSSPRGVAEALLRLPWMYVARCVKPTATASWKCEKALENLTGPNGINVVGSRLLIAMPTLNRVAVYQRADNGTLTWEKEITTAAAGDNIHVTGDGRVFLTSHWNSFRFIAHSSDANVAAPTLVSQLDPVAGTEKLLLRTTKLNAGAVAVAFNNELLIGARVRGRHLGLPGKVKLCFVFFFFLKKLRQCRFRSTLLQSTTIVWSRPAPTPIHLARTPSTCSMRAK